MFSIFHFLDVWCVIFIFFKKKCSYFDMFGTLQHIIMFCFFRVDILIWTADTNLTWNRHVCSSVFTLPKDVLLRWLILWISSTIYFKCHSIGKIIFYQSFLVIEMSGWTWTLNLEGSCSLTTCFSKFELWHWPLLFLFLSHPFSLPLVQNSYALRYDDIEWQ